MSRNKKSTKRGSSYNKLRAEFFWEMALSVLNVRTCIHTYIHVGVVRTRDDETKEDVDGWGGGISTRGKGCL